MDDKDKAFIKSVNKEFTSPAFLAKRCYHQDGSYHLINNSLSCCGSIDVDHIACAERDGLIPGKIAEELEKLNKNDTEELEKLKKNKEEN